VRSNDISEELLKKGEKARAPLVPAKSGVQYKKKYDQFQQWLKNNHSGNKNVNGTIILTYIEDMVCIYSFSIMSPNILHSNIDRQMYRERNRRSIALTPPTVPYHISGVLPSMSIRVLPDLQRSAPMRNVAKAFPIVVQVRSWSSNLKFENIAISCSVWEDVDHERCQVDRWWGGRISKKAKFPWQAALYSSVDTSFHCGGNLLNERVILTGKLPTVW
jgi:hypothetical protein